MKVCLLPPVEVFAAWSGWAGGKFRSSSGIEDDDWSRSHVHLETHQIHTRISQRVFFAHGTLHYQNHSSNSLPARLWLHFAIVSAQQLFETRIAFRREQQRWYGDHRLSEICLHASWDWLLWLSRVSVGVQRERRSKKPHSPEDVVGHLAGASPILRRLPSTRPRRKKLAFPILHSLVKCQTKPSTRIWRKDSKMLRFMYDAPHHRAISLRSNGWEWNTDDMLQTYIGHVLVSVNPFRDCEFEYHVYRYLSLTLP